MHKRVSIALLCFSISLYLLDLFGNIFCLSSSAFFGFDSFASSHLYQPHNKNEPNKQTSSHQNNLDSFKFCFGGVFFGQSHQIHSIQYFNFTHIFFKNNRTCFLLILPFILSFSVCYFIQIHLSGTISKFLICTCMLCVYFFFVYMRI